jgi:hypothetical protein
MDASHQRNSAATLATVGAGWEDEAMGRDGDDPVRQFAAAWDAAAAALAQWVERTAAAVTDAFNKLASDPAVRAVLEGWHLAPVRDRRECGCSCVGSHPDDIGVCDKDAVITRRLTTDLDGDVDVPLCAPCAVAQGLAELAR